MKKAFIFDLDGTLIDSLADLADSCNYALRKLGYPEHEREKYRYFVGNGVKILMRNILPKGTEETAVDNLHKCFEEHYSYNYCNKTKAYKEIAEVLAYLKNKGIVLCILTNKPHVFVSNIVGKLFAENTFAIAYGQRESIPKKPDPTALLDIMQIIGVSEEETVYVGDSGVDMQTAVNAGVFGLGALWGFREKDELLENGASAVIENPNMIKNFLS